MYESGIEREGEESMNTEAGGVDYSWETGSSIYFGASVTCQMRINICFVKLITTNEAGGVDYTIMFINWISKLFLITRSQMFYTNVYYSHFKKKNRLKKISGIRVSF